MPTYIATLFTPSGRRPERERGEGGILRSCRSRLLVDPPAADANESARLRSADPSARISVDSSLWQPFGSAAGRAALAAARTNGLLDLRHAPGQARCQAAKHLCHAASASNAPLSGVTAIHTMLATTTRSGQTLTPESGVKLPLRTANRRSFGAFGGACTTSAGIWALPRTAACAHARCLTCCTDTRPRVRGASTSM